MTWSKSEKTLAPNAFDAAVSWDLYEVMEETKRLASKIKQPSDLQELEHGLTGRRKDIDRKYEFRASHLMDVLGRLVYENRVSEAELRGLHKDKLKSIRLFAEFLKESSA